MEIARAAVLGLRRVFRPGFNYKKADVMLAELTLAAQRQATRLDDPAELARRARLNTALDRVNAKFGRGSLRLAAADRERAAWHMRRSLLTLQYKYRLPADHDVLDPQARAEVDMLATSCGSARTCTQFVATKVDESLRRQLQAPIFGAAIWTH